MDIFYFVIFLGIFNLVFRYLWQWIIIFPISFLFVLLKLQRRNDMIMRILKILGSYILVSSTALITLATIKASSGITIMLLCPLIALFTLIFSYAGNRYEAYKEAKKTMNFDLKQRLDKDAGFEMFLEFGVIIFYFVFLFVPSIASNVVTSFLLSLILWLIYLPLIGWVVRLGGFLFLINIAFYGISAIGLMLTSIFLRKKKNTV
jgi:hypothetical protein